MSLALVELGFERPRESFKFNIRDTVIAVAWASLVVLVGMSIASSIQSGNQVAYQSSSSSNQGL